MHEVIAAIATAPWSSSNSLPSTDTLTGLDTRPVAPSAADWNTFGVPEPLPPSWMAAGSLAGKDSSTASSTPVSAGESVCAT